MIQRIIVERKDLDFRLPASVPIYYNFNHEIRMGVAQLYIDDEEDCIRCDMNIVDAFDPFPFIPAIAYKGIKDGELRQITCIGLCAYENEDESIQSIADQKGRGK